MRRLSAMTLLLVLFAGCGRGPNENVAGSSGDSSPSPQASGEQAKSKASGVKLPDDPFFTDFAYTGATAGNALTMGNTTSVWFKTSDDISKVAEFYKTKFPGGSNHVEAERAYFTQTKPAGGSYGATVTKQPDGPTQIILKVERP